MRITTRELRKLIRESIEDKLQREGIFDDMRRGVENFSASAGLTKPDPDFIAKELAKELAKTENLKYHKSTVESLYKIRPDEFKTFIENPTSENWKKVNPDMPETSDEMAAEAIKTAYPGLEEDEINKLSSDPKFKERLNAAAFKVLLPIYAKIGKNISQTGTPGLTSESIRRIIRKEIENLIRSRR